MKICIIQRKGIEESPVICDLSSVLIQEGCETFLLIQAYEKDLFQTIKKMGVDVLAVQSEIGDEQWVRDMISEIKYNFPRTPVVSFGSIPTFMQKKSNLGADFLVVGEPEIPFVSIVNYLKGTNNELINVIDMNNGEHANIQPLEFDLNSLPMPDRDIYYRRYKFLRDFPVKRFLMSRGCVLSCSFCYISALRNLLGKVKVRFKAPERVIQEVLDVKNKYRLDFVHFSDDLFPVWNKSWLEKFSSLWSKEVRLPFSIVTLSNFINDRVAELLKEAGCKFVIVGVETYDEKRRIVDLEKTSVTNSVLIGAVDSLRKKGIRTLSVNIIGLPGEDLSDYFKTAEFNRTIGVDFALGSPFVPIPGTILGDKLTGRQYDSEKKKILYYVMDVFPLASKNETFQVLSMRAYKNPILSFLFSKIGQAYSLLKLKTLYNVSFLEGLKYFMKVGTFKDRRTNLHQVA